jgi:hypothetical protein
LWLFLLWWWWWKRVVERVEVDLRRWWVEVNWVLERE